MALCISVLTLDASTCRQRRIRTLCPTLRRHWKAWWGQHISCQWISSQAFGKYTTLTVGNLGFYEFTCMMFELCNDPGTFQHLMQNTLGELNLTYCMIYLYNVIIFGCTEEEHLEHLHVVFERFWEFNLKFKPSKCSFCQLEIIYLAHHVPQWGILLSHNNV